MDFRTRLVMALTEYDRKQANRRGHNPNALALYFQSVQENVMPALAKGASKGKAIAEGFIPGSGVARHVARAMLKAGELTAAEAEALKG